MADIKLAPTFLHGALRGHVALTTTAPDTPTESERRWLWMPVACTVFLILAVVAGSVRIAWRLSRSNAEVEESRSRKSGWLWNQRYGCIKYILRSSGAVGLAAGLLGLIIAARRFYEHWDQVRAGTVNVWFIVLPALTYFFLAVAFLFAGLGLRWKRDENGQQVYLALRQNAQLSLLAGMASGISQEVLCGVDNKTFNVPDGWSESCQMLGGSCALLLLGMIVAQADGVEKRDFEPAPPVKPKEPPQEVLTRQESGNASLLNKGESLFNRLGPKETVDMDSTAEKTYWSPEHPLTEDGLGAHGVRPADGASSSTIACRGLREPLLGASPPWYDSEIGFLTPDGSRFEDPLDFPREVDESCGGSRFMSQDEDQLLPGAYAREVPLLSDGSSLTGRQLKSPGACGFTPPSSSLLASPPMRPTVLAV